MNRIIEIALFNAVAAAVLALIAAGVGRIVRRPALVHCLWLLVLVKLVTPPFFRIPVIRPVNWPATAETTPRVQVLAATPPSGPTELSPDGQIELDHVGASSTTSTHEPLAVHAPDERVITDESGSSASRLDAARCIEPLDGRLRADEPAIRPAAMAAVGPSFRRLAAWTARNWPFLVVGLWLAGSVCWFGLVATRSWRFYRVLQIAPPAPRAVQQQTRRLAGTIGIGRGPEVWLVPGAVSPMLWAIGARARLVFPADLLERLTEESRATLIAHELAHFHRRDHWVRIVELVAIGLYWWHPIVWWARREIQRAEEECCDAWVVWELPRAARRYAEALLDTIDFLSEARPVLPPGASGIGHVRLIKQRLTMIMRGTTPRTLSALGRFAVLAVAAVFLPLLPTWAKPPSSMRDLVDLARLAHQDEGEAEAVPAAPRAEDRIEPLAPSASPVRHELWVVANSPDGRKLVRSGANRFVEFSNTLTGQTMDFSGRQINSVAFAPDSKTFATGGADQLVRLWDAETGEELATLTGHGKVVTSVAFAPDGRTLATASWDQTVRLWDVGTRETVATMKDLARPVNCVRFSPDGRLLAAAAGDWRTAESGEVRLWDAATLVELARFECSSGAGAAAFSPDGKTLAAGEWNGRVRLWDVATRAVQDELSVHKNQIVCEAFAPNGLALSRSRDADLRTLWDALSIVQQNRPQRWGTGLFNAIALPALDEKGSSLFEMNTRANEETEASGPGAALMGRPRASGHPLDFGGIRDDGQRPEPQADR